MKLTLNLNVKELLSIIKLVIFLVVVVPHLKVDVEPLKVEPPKKIEKVVSGHHQTNNKRCVLKE